VGAVVVRNGRRIGEGRHLCAGCAHAEVEALNACTETPGGATLYVTLEPCCTTGRTPPARIGSCAKASRAWWSAAAIPTAATADAD
jgi:pyrimidine deaminase RibD-like protein